MDGCGIMERAQKHAKTGVMGVGFEPLEGDTNSYLAVVLCQLLDSS